VRCSSTSSSLVPGEIALPAGSLSTIAHSVCTVKGSVAAVPRFLLYTRWRALARKALSPRSHGANDGVTRKTQKEFWAACPAGRGSIRLTIGPSCCQVSVDLNQRRGSGLTASLTEAGIMMALLSGRTGGKASLRAVEVVEYPRTGARLALPPRKDCHCRSTSTSRGIGRRAQLAMVSVADGASLQARGSKQSRVNVHEVRTRIARSSSATLAETWA
jgi:hypothetical protein